MILDLWPECTYARTRLLSHLKTMYSQSTHFETFMQHLNISDKTAGTETLRQLELWLRYDEGRIVYLPSKGTARVREVNPKIGVIRLLLSNGEKMSLRIDEAERLSQSLADDHFLARTVTDSEALAQKVDNDPGELLRQLFASIKREVTLSELKEMLSGMVPEAQWSKWWTKARRDSRLIAGSGKKPMLHWSDSVSEGSAVLLETFKQSTTRERIELLKKHASRSRTLAKEMSRILADEASDTLHHDPSLALEIGITIADLPDCSEVATPFHVNDLLVREDAGSIIGGIKNRLTRKKTVQMLADARDDWPRIYMTLLKNETDTSLLKLLFESLYETDRDGVLAAEIGRIFSVPSDNPAFYVWLCREIPHRPELHRYANRNLIRTLLDLLDNSSFREHQTALRALFDPGEVADKAMETLDVSTGRTLLDLLSRVRGLEDYRKESVRQKLFTLFPELHEKKKEWLLVTKASLDKKRLEYEKLIKKDIPHAAKEIQRTREYGDLRENFEYHEARRQQELLSSRAKTLHDELITARAIEPDTVDTSKISIGTRCRLEPETAGDIPVTLTILGPWDSDPSNNVLSYTSAAGSALLNAPKGSTVDFGGNRYRVETIDIWSP
jgi:transcription elongation GreA/GreB family factor